MAGVMVVYGHPPITHLPPPAVGASPNAAIHDFKGSCRRSVRITGGADLPWLSVKLRVRTAYALRYQIRNQYCVHDTLYGFNR